MQYPRLLCLASVVLLYARSSVTCDGGLISRPTGSTLSGLQSHVLEVLSEQAVDTVTELNLGLEDEGPDVLLVLDPNGVICWEEVELDAFTNATLLRWLYQQHDVLTMSDRDRTGEPVQMPAGLQNPASTLKEHIEEAWASNAAYIALPSILLSLFQMTMLEEPDNSQSQTDKLPSRLDPAHLKLTSIHSFWKSVETSAATGISLPANANYSNSLQSDEPHLVSLASTIIILPRITTMIRPVSKDYKRTAASHLWSDTVTWNRDLLLEMLGKFLDITGAKTIPNLSEYRILPDKVALQRMYQSYHDADPEHHTPPIPTAQVQLPLTPARLEELCYSDLNTTHAERNAVVNSLLQALHQLESSVGMDSPVRNVIEGGGGDWMGQYMVKREYSEGSFHVFGIVVPDLRSSSASRHQKAHHKCTEGVCQNSITSSSSEACDDTSGGGGSIVNSPQAHQPVDTSPAAFSSGSAGAKADDEAGDTGRHPTGSDADLGLLGAASGTGTCGRKQWPISKAVAVMHKAQTLIWPLVPQRIAQLRPVAKLLGRGSHISTSSSSSGGCNRSSNTMHQAAFCPNVDTQIVSGKSTDLTQAKPAKEATFSSTSLERATDNQASAMEASIKVDSKPVSRPDLLPDLQTGDAVTSDILIPTEQASSADAELDHLDTPHASEYGFADWKLPVELVSLLDVTADRILKESCGEGWLMQPRIADMTRLEYRVYMLNGAQAVNSSSEQSMVVYTPCILDPVGGIATFNITLPNGFFCSDTMVDPSTDLNNIDRGDFSQLTPWRSQETYDMIIRAGHDGAKALVGSSEGHLLNTIQNVFIRVDIVLAAHWLTDDEVALVPMINEMDWLNSAGMLAAFWKDPSVLYDMEGVDDDDMNGVLYHLLQKSPGHQIAKALHAEVLRVWRA